MDKLILFITILAWIAGSISTVWYFMSLYHTNNYTDLEKALDQIRLGGTYTFPLLKPFIIAVMSWTWILTFQYF
jgi:hypothetical protein